MEINMNKFWKYTGIAAVFVAVFIAVGMTTAFAQGPSQPDNGTPRGTNQMQGRSESGMNLMSVDEADIHAAIADALGLTLDEFEAEIAAGKTPVILAEELGVDFAEVQAAMDAVHEAAFDQAVADGVITQDQADWILSHRGGEAGQSGGMGNSQSGSRGGGNSQGANNAGHSHNNTGGGTGDCVQTP